MTEGAVGPEMTTALACVKAAGGCKFKARGAIPYAGPAITAPVAGAKPGDP